MPCRHKDPRPRYMVLGVLSLIALHIKLQSFVHDDSKVDNSQEAKGQRHLLDGTGTRDAVLSPAFRGHRIVNSSKGYGMESANNMNDPQSFIGNLQIALDGKHYRRIDVFKDRADDEIIPQPEVSTNCDKLFDGDRDAIEYTTFVQENRTNVYTLDNSYEFPKERCPDFIKSRHYIMEGAKKMELDFPIAFSILMFKDVEQTERLLRTIYRPHNYYCIHVDSKSGNGTFQAIQSIANCFPNVILASHRSNVAWGTFTVIEPEMTCMRDLSRWQWKYFINLTGQEVALKTNYQIVRILQAFNGANDVEGLPSRNKYRYTYVHKDGRRTSELKTPAPHNITVVKGAVHALLSRPFCNFLLNNPISTDFVEWIKDTGVPDETLFSTLNRNPQLGVPGAYLGTDSSSFDKNPTVARFKNWGELPCATYSVRSVCVLSSGDLWLLPKRPELFANKFHYDHHPLAYDCVEKRYFDMVRRERAGDMTFDTSYYEKLAFVRNHQ